MNLSESKTHFLKKSASLLLAALLLPVMALAETDGTVNCKALVLRKTNSKDAKALQTLGKGDSVTILSVKGDWYKVSYGKYKGYVLKKYVTADKKVTEKESGGSTSSSSQAAMKGIDSISDIGSAPATSKSGDKGTDVKKLQQALTLRGYFDGKIDGSFGDQTENAVKKFQKAKGLSQDGVAGSVTIKLLFGQEAASDSSTTSKSSGSSDAAMKGITKISDIGSVPATSKKGDKGAKVKKLQQALTLEGYFSGKIDGSFGDQTENAVKKFQKAKGLSQDGIAGSTTIKLLFGQDSPDNSSTSSKSNDSSDAAMKGIEKISDIGSAPAASKKGDKGTKVKKLQQALTLRGYFSGKIDSSFGQQTENAVKKSQKAKGLSQDGVAGSVTIKLLFGEDAADGGNSASDSKKYTTEKLNWYKGGSTAIPKGKNFTVKDVWSGKTFECHRWSGGDHLDAEPLTAEDTKIMKGIYGGSWSWSRRPILIKYGGHVYAASMNGMPHGTQTITDNNFEGQFCIHFYQSKTHGTDKVDDDHQKCVEIAAKASW